MNIIIVMIKGGYLNYRGGIFVPGEFSYFCPYLGKKVTVKCEADKKNITSYKGDRHRGICQVNKGVCSGKCMFM